MLTNSIRSPRKSPNLFSILENDFLIISKYFFQFEFTKNLQIYFLLNILLNQSFIHPYPSYITYSEPSSQKSIISASGICSFRTLGISSFSFLLSILKYPHTPCSSRHRHRSSNLHFLQQQQFLVSS